MPILDIISLLMCLISAHLATYKITTNGAIIGMTILDIDLTPLVIPV